MCDKGRIWRGLPGMALAITTLLTVGCSTFHRDWEAAREQPGSGADLQGSWDGTWLSDVNGHNGGLKCILTPLDDGRYEARFHATYGSVFTFEYMVPLQVGPAEDGESRSFEGSADLGWLAGGQYYYRGQVRGDEFVSAYDSNGDCGTFRMERARGAGVQSKPRIE